MSVGGVIIKSKDIPISYSPIRKSLFSLTVVFWHGHDCRNTRPADNAEYWQKKRERNMRHDKEITALFENRGWTVIRIWECELKKKNFENLKKKILTRI